MKLQTMGDLEPCEELPESGLIIEATRDELRAMTGKLFGEEVVVVGKGEFEAMKVVLDRLPKTADGVPIIFDQDYFFLHVFNSTLTEEVCVERINVIGHPKRTFGGTPRIYYSTREAALAAKKTHQCTCQASEPNTGAAMGGCTYRA